MADPALFDPARRSRAVAAMFGRIAGRYDLMNTIMTGGLDRSWRRLLAQTLDVPPGGVVLDAGTGTGKVARAISRFTLARLVVGMDFALPMLRAGRAAKSAPAREGSVRLCAADTLRLPVPDGAVNAVASAFVLRNVLDVDAALAEQVRVLAGGGVVAALETTPGPRGAVGVAFRWYFDRVVPIVGGLVSGDRSAYSYLPASSARFLQPEALGQAFERAGLGDVRIRRLALGTVVLASGRKPFASAAGEPVRLASASREKS